MKRQQKKSIFDYWWHLMIENQVIPDDDDVEAFIGQGEHTHARKGPMQIPRM